AQEPRSKRPPRTQLQSAFERIFGFLKTSAPDVAQPEKPERSMKVRIELHGAPAVHRRGLEVVAERMHQPQIRDDGWRQWVELDRLLKALDRRRQTTGHGLEPDRVPVKRGGVAGIERNRAPITLLRRHKIPLVAILHG